MQQKQDEDNDDEEDDDDDEDGKKKTNYVPVSTVPRIDTTYYDYLINMSLRNLTKERRNDILKEQQEKHDKLQALQKKCPEDLYEDDLDHFEAEYHKVIDRFIASGRCRLSFAKSDNVQCLGDRERTCR